LASIIDKHRKMFLQRAFGIAPDETVTELKKEFKSVKTYEKLQQELPHKQKSIPICCVSATAISLTWSLSDSHTADKRFIDSVYLHTFASTVSVHTVKQILSMPVC
jgi:2-methylcitrate dehydratase PrpD